ncbi:MAG: pilus assembly PilX family protein [Cellvibrionaceae bacterium]
MKNILHYSYLNKKSLARKTDHGVVLIIVLVLLLVMTAVGVNLMSGSTMQERMAGSNRQVFVARINAESGMRQAQSVLANLTTDFYTDFLDEFVEGSNDGYYISLHPQYKLEKFNTSSNTDSIDLTKVKNWTSGNSVAQTVAATEDPGYRYVIEFIGEQRLSNNGVINVGKEAVLDANTSYAFKIMAIGYGENRKITAILESIYTTAQGDPDA